MTKSLMAAGFMSLACLAHGATISTFCTTGLGPVPPSSGTTTSTCPGLPTPDGTINFITLTYQYDLTIGIGAGSATFTHDVNYGGVLDGFDDLTPQTVTNLSRPQLFITQDGTPPVSASMLSALAAGGTITGHYANATRVTSGVSFDFAWTVNYTPPGAPIPEPAAMALVGVGLMGLVWVGRRRRTHAD